MVGLKRVRSSEKVPAFKPPPALAEYEDEVFRKAVQFVAVLYKSGRAPLRHEFLDFPTAAKEALKLKDDQGRTGLLYAVTDAGRSVCLDRVRWPHFEELWKERCG